MKQDEVPPPIAPPPRMVLFDLDDTLCDYAGARSVRLRIAFSQALAATARDRDVDLDRLIEESVAIHPHGTEHFPELFRRHRLGNERDAARAAEWYRTNRFHGLALFDDAIKTLTAVRQSESVERLGLITNGPSEVQRAKIELLGVERYIDFFIISEEFGAAKPDPAIFAEALRRGGIAATEAVFIGDSPDHDMIGARAAGIRAIWINRGGREWPLDDDPPEYQASNLAAVRRMLDAESWVLSAE
jgi:putative hydrolase of the HAD superfamily